MTPEWTYEPGDVVYYVAFGGSTRRVLVTEREENVKNGEPGFDGVDLDEPNEMFRGVWGYDSQITRVERRQS